MRRLVKIAPILTLIAVLLMGTLNVSAYGYKISVSAGNGEFAGGQVRDEVDAGLVSVSQANNTVTVGGKTYTITKMPDGKAPADRKYFFEGLKLAGHDNANASTSITLDGVYKDKDLEFVVAYGMKSSMVSYTINYLDPAGNPIHPADTFYGVAGDRVTVSYKYVDGYIPQAYTGVATLSANAAENNFAFVYNPAAGTGQVITVIDGVTVINNPAAPGAGAGAGAGANAAAPGAAIGDNATPLANGPADTVNLNDGSTPTTDNPDATDVDDNKGPLANIPTAGKIAGAAAIIAAIAAIVAAIARRNAGDDDDDDDEDDEE